VKFWISHVLSLVLFNSASYAQQGPHLAENAPVDCAFETTTTDLFGVIEEKSPEAMKSWPEAKARFLRGLPDNHSLFVTFILVDQEQRAEYVFLAVDAISDEGVSGRLWSNLFVVEGFEHGDRFLVEEEAISDWLISKPDGTEDGNLIGKYMDTLQQCAHLNNPSDR
jgi:hypothetical protein